MTTVGREPTLILLNGPPGSGKSTLALRYVQDHPLALDLDIDRVRSMLGRWQEAAGEAGLAARAIALAAAGTHLRSGRDVIIPQLIAEPRFLQQLAALAAEVAVPFVEIVLLDSKENTRTRFLARTDESSGPVDPAHREAARQLDLDGGLARLDRYHDALTALLTERPAARVVRTRHGAVDRAYADILALIDLRPG